MIFGFIHNFAGPTESPSCVYSPSLMSAAERGVSDTPQRKREEGAGVGVGM